MRFGFRMESPHDCGMRRAFSLAGCGLVAWYGLVGLAGAASPAPPGTNFFPIMGWNWVPNDPAVLREIHEAGLTVAGFVAPETLNACEAAGLKAIVADPRVSRYNWEDVDAGQARESIESLAAEVGHHPALYGYELCDEPATRQFAGLEKVAAAVREFSRGKWPYINLLPDYATSQQLGASNYTEYLERFVATCHPSILSYDNYSLMADGSLRPNYWSNLEAVRNVCAEHHLEFWNIILAVAHFQYRELNAADFRFQVYTTLAYGGRGITYFTYFAPKLGNYRMAPVDQFGNRTPNWYFMQNVNLQVQKLAPTLLQLTSDKVYHFGEVPPGCQGPSTNSLVAKMSPGDFVVGDFTHRDGSRYVLIVNKNFHESMPCVPQFRAPPRRVLHVSPYTGQLLPFQGEDVWTAPGQGVLLKLEY